MSNPNKYNIEIDPELTPCTYRELIKFEYEAGEEKDPKCDYADFIGYGTRMFLSRSGNSA